MVRLGAVVHVPEGRTRRPAESFCATSSGISTSRASSASPACPSTAGNDINQTMLRRTFLQSAPTAAALAAGTPRSGIKLGFDSYSIRAFQWKAIQLLDYAAGLKLDTIQLSSLNDYESLEPAYLQQVKDHAARVGIAVDAGMGCICGSSASYNVGEVYNAGGGRHSHCSMLEAIQLCQEISGRELNYQYCDDARSGDHIWYVSDVSKFHHYPDWSYRYDLRTTLEEIFQGWSQGGSTPPEQRFDRATAAKPGRSTTSAKSATNKSSKSAPTPPRSG